nr:LysR substrate-binding domain-containing protein [Mycobacterium sp. SMC-8]
MGPQLTDRCLPGHAGVPRRLPRCRFEPSVAFRAEDYATVQGFVAAGLGVSLVPSLAAARVRDDVAVRRLTGHRPVRRICVATASAPRPASTLATVVGSIAAAGARLADEAVYSIAAHVSSVA